MSIEAHSLQPINIESPALTAALAYAAQGFPVLPVWSIAGGRCTCPNTGSKDCKPGKHPIPTRGLSEAMLDPELVRAWWGRYPDAHVGVALPDGVAVVDVDPRNGGEATLRALEAAHGPLPPTWTAATGGGGLHAWYRVPAGLALPGSLGDGVDVKQLGGYVLAPPSGHASGRAYAWLRAPGAAPLGDAPAWLLALGRPRGERSAVRIVDEDDRIADDSSLDAIVALVEPHYTEGKKHHLAKNLGGWLKQRGFGAGDVAYVVERLPSRNPAERVKAAVAAFGIEKPFGWHELRELVGEPAAAELEARVPNPRRERELADLARARALIRVPAPVPVSVVAPPPLPDGAGLPFIVCDTRGSQFWVCRGRDYFDPVAKSVLPARALEAGYRAVRDDGKPAKLKADDLAAEATIAKRVVRDFAARGVEWKARERAIVQGYELPAIAPAYDAEADAWLRALAGARYDYLARWFAACRQDQIQSLAACLVLVGGTGIGKTLIALLAARMWGAAAPVPLGHAIDKFNSTITNCPIVLDDEAARMKKADVSTNEFREMLSARTRHYEPKGVDKRELRGCQRFVITCNAFSDLRFSDVGALEIVEALADRLLVVPCGEADAVRRALAALRLDNSDDVDLERLDRHVAWVVANTAVPKTRFLASPGRDDLIARRAVLDGIVQQYPELFERIREAIERGEHTAPVDPPAVFVRHGVLWVRGDRVSALQSARHVYGILAPWAAPGEPGKPPRSLVKVGGQVVAARPFDLERLAGELLEDEVSEVSEVRANPISSIRSTHD